MEDRSLYDSFRDLSTLLVADACVRLNVPLRPAPARLRSVRAGASLRAQLHFQDYLAHHPPGKSAPWPSACTA